MVEKKARAGYWLTQKNIADESRVFVKQVITFNEEDGWEEWDDRSKIIWEEEHPITDFLEEENGEEKNPAKQSYDLHPLS